MSSFQDSFREELHYFGQYYERVISTLYGGESDLHKVCRYVLKTEGKKVRPLLCLLTAKGFQEDHAAALPAAAALEFVHTYSLVHDDLPAMDNDSLRRGQPTAHIKFNEALAILAGDALLSDSFRLLSDQTLWPPDVDQIHCQSLVRELALHAGGQGMVAGQALDLHYERNQKNPDLKVLETIHQQKTGELMGAAMSMGALSCGQNTDIAKQLFEVGLELGHIFQLVDDLLDDLPGTGKSQGKDKSTGKLTYLSYFDRTTCENMARDRTEAVLSQLRALEADRELLLLTEMLCNRSS
jgi:geranylgeranyl pyrophosphate synthase